jgi:hypothetical protein
LVAALNVIDGLPFHRCIHLEEVAPLEQLQHPLVGAPFCASSRILAIALYRHRHASLHRRRVRRRPGKKAVIGHTIDSCFCHRHTIFSDFPSAAHPMLT